MANIYTKLFEIKKAGIKLQRDTKAFNYKYATLSQIQDKFGDEFIKHKLLVTHRIENNEVITTILDLESENTEFFKVESSIKMSEDVKAQDKGSEITYFRRYNLLSLLDLEVEDDDGKKATESVKESKTEYKIDMMDYIKRIKTSELSTDLIDLYKEFMSQNPTQKQIEWYVKESAIRKKQLIG